jgi:hypothetical protein
LTCFFRSCKKLSNRVIKKCKTLKVVCDVLDNKTHELVSVAPRSVLRFSFDKNIQNTMHEVTTDILNVFRCEKIPFDLNHLTSYACVCLFFDVIPPLKSLKIGYSFYFFFLSHSNKCVYGVMCRRQIESAANSKFLIKAVFTSLSPLYIVFRLF